MPANDSITETTQMAMTGELRKVRKRLRSARELLAGVETMIKKGQLHCPGGQIMSTADLLYSLAF